MRIAAAAATGAAVLMLFATSPLRAQSADPKAATGGARTQAQAEGDGPKKMVDEFAEVAKVLTGPAANPECVWLGRRAVSLLWRDDLDTAFRHLDLYDRFGCPAAHIQATFRCMVRQGNIDLKSTETLSGRVHACWINPDSNQTPPPAAAANTPTTQSR
jgi:hypothetical protein